MDILYLLVPLAALLAYAIGAGFYWALRSGQFDDLDAPALAILIDDEQRDAETKPPKAGAL
jgi:cbb3-type cytochrome oxidase maturation protein